MTQDSERRATTLCTSTSRSPLKADAKGGPTSPSSRTRTGTSTSNVGVTQYSGSGRKRRAREPVERPGRSCRQGRHGATQTQGSSVAAERTFFLQDSTGVSTIDGKAERASGPACGARRAPDAGRSTGRSGWIRSRARTRTTRYNLDQSSNQHASDPDTQDDQQYAECHTSRQLHASIEQIQQQGQHQNNSCSGILVRHRQLLQHERRRRRPGLLHGATPTSS